MSALGPDVRVHVVGVGGAGMSGLARALVERGLRVSGCDDRDSAVLTALAEAGVDVSVGHDATHVSSIDVLLWSPAVARDHVELVAARERNVTMLERSSALADLASSRRLIGLAGTHGKTTSSSMLVHVAVAAGRDDAWLVGAPIVGVGANGHWGRGDLLVELDESYGTFAEVRPHALGLLNLEADHLDHYGSLEALESAFVELIGRTSGPVVAWADDPGLASVLPRAAREVTLVALAGHAHDVAWRVRDMRLSRRGATARLEGPGESVSMSLNVTGAHNVANAAVVAVLASQLGVRASAIEAGLSNFAGAPRRFEYRGRWRDLDVYDDYAHLPGEIRATLEATRSAGYERPLVVFQPHRVTRTLALADAFAPAFAGARHVVITDLYDAGEANPAGVTGEIVADALRRGDAGRALTYCANLRDVAGLLAELAEGADVVLLLGAGDVGTIADDLEGLA